LNSDLYKIWLSLITGIGPRKHAALLGEFESAEEVYGASYEELAAVPGVSEANAEVIIKSRDLSAARRVLEESEKRRIRIMTLTDGDYPELLKQIHDPPAVLYIRGSLPDDNLKKAGIIGSRHCSDYGRAITRELSRKLAENNIVVVSGMARGIDSDAHRGAIEAGGLTVAVLGCGPDICYPPENLELMKQISLHGCLLSEYPPGAKPEAGYFPARNRIISGLSHVLVVTEAARRSGTLITVNQALEQGREVMAVPGNINSRLSDGPNELIRDGAGIVTSYQDILHILNINTNEHVQQNNPADLAPDEKVVYDCMAFQPESFENIVDKCGLSAQTVNYILTMLELKGYLLKMPGQRYGKTR
jgi:DNA processing protein